MNKIYRYKDYSPMEINENYSPSSIESNISTDVVYEIRGVDANGDEYTPKEEDDDYNYNPYDLKEMVKLLIKKRKKEFKHPGLFMVKVTTEKVPIEQMEELRLEIEAEKYNL